MESKVREAIKKSNEKQRKRLDKFTKTTKPLKQGAKVMIKLNGTKKQEKFEGPYIVKECITKWKYRLLHVVTKAEKIRNFNQLKVLKNVD